MSAKLKPSAKASKTAAPAAASAAKPAATGVGELYVDSRPRGAKVLVDGKDMGVTPLRVPGQPVGSHVIRLELADHAPWTKTETVTAGATARVTGSLERIK
jgi:hypothetical protein